MLDGTEVKKTLGSHLVFVFILGLGTLIRVTGEAGDGNTIMFAMVLAVGVIFAMSLFNQFVIDLFNDLNDKWIIINYCVPALIILSILLIFKIPVEAIDIVIFPTLILTADLVMYSMRKRSS